MHVRRSVRVGVAALLGAAALMAVVGAADVLRAPVAATSVVAPGTFTRVSVDQSGGDPDAISRAAAISAGGRYVAFVSEASDLVPRDGNGLADVFRRDLLTGDIVRVSVSAAGGDPDGPSDRPAISGDGRYVAFASFATNLGPPDPNGAADVFVRDLVAGTTRYVAVATRAAISDDGQVIAVSAGWRLSAVNLTTGAQIASLSGRRPALSADGRYVSFEAWVHLDEDDWGNVQVLRYNLVSGKGGPITELWTDGDDEARDSDISADGTTVVFHTRSLVLAPNPNGVWDVFAWSSRTHELVQVSVSPEGSDGNVWSDDAAVDGTGRYVAFTSWATNLVPGAAGGIFRRDLVTNTTAFVGPLGGGASITDDGQIVAFATVAALDPADGNGLTDVYVWRAAPSSSCAGRPATVVGSGTITGTEYADVIVGSSGDDVIDALGGNDLVCAGAGNDRVDGGTGNDDLRGQQGDDTLLGGEGRDVLAGSVGTDTCAGGPGVDRLTGCETVTPNR